MTVPPQPRRTTARRIVVAFAAILTLFALALAVMIIALARIAEAEREVARLDHAKHAGHQAAALAREQYIHQAHTLLEWNDSHLPHYEQVAIAARAATAHLRSQVTTPEGRARADKIEALVEDSDRQFRELVLPAIRTGDRSRLTALHELTEQPVQQVVALNEELNRSIEASSDAAQRRAEAIRSRARLAVIGCFALAILLATAVGLYLMRSISGPVAALRAGARRIGAGDLGARIGLDGDDELAELARVFDQMAEDLGRHQGEALEAHRLASIGQVASGIAHELNNPLGVILGYLRLVRREPELGEREELRIIEAEVHQCQVIVAGLLDLARPVRLQLDRVDVADVVRDAVARLEESGTADGVSVHVHVEGSLDITADESKLRQVISNLIGNALEAVRDPAARGSAIEIKCAADAARVSVHVDDAGPGIAAEALPRLFEPFFTTRARGHGLGLAIARSLARAHGGDVELTARAAGGTRATLWIPRHGVPA